MPWARWCDDDVKDVLFLLVQFYDHFKYHFRVVSLYRIYLDEYLLNDSILGEFYM